MFTLAFLKFASNYIAIKAQTQTQIPFCIEYMKKIMDKFEYLFSFKFIFYLKILNVYS